MQIYPYLGEDKNLDREKRIGNFSVNLYYAIRKCLIYDSGAHQ